MAEFTPAGHERVNAFHVEGTYLFKHYFEGEAVWDELRQYYNNAQYRFEVPQAALDHVEGFLRGHGYALVVIEDPTPFAVAVRKYTAHPENIFKASVLHRGVPDYNVFVMTDREAVADAVAEGAVPLEDAPIEPPF